MESVTEKLERVTARLKSKPVPITEPVERNRPFPGIDLLDRQQVVQENAVLWELVEIYEQALRFWNDHEIGNHALAQGESKKRQARLHRQRKE